MAIANIVAGNTPPTEGYAEYSVTSGQRLGIRYISTTPDSIYVYIGSYRGAIPGYAGIAAIRRNTSGSPLGIKGGPDSGSLPTDGSTISSSFPYPWFVVEKNGSEYSWTSSMMTTREGALAYKATSITLMNNRPGYLWVWYSQEASPRLEDYQTIGTTPIRFHLSGSFSGAQYKKVPIVY